MANYKPNTKGIIARDTVIPPKSRFDPVDAFFLVCAIISIALFLFLYFISDSLLWPILIAVVVLLYAAYIFYLYILPPILRRKKGPLKYYLELDTVSSAIVIDKTRRKGFGRHRRTVTYHIYTISFKSRRTYTVELNNLTEFPTMKNKENIPSHRATIKGLIDGDTCYLKMCEGDDTIIDIFDTKYYVPSPTDFVERDGRYYLIDSDI